MLLLQKVLSFGSPSCSLGLSLSLYEGEIRKGAVGEDLEVGDRS